MPVRTVNDDSRVASSILNTQVGLEFRRHDPTDTNSVESIDIGGVVGSLHIQVADDAIIRQYRG